MIEYRDKQGNPVTLDEWAKLNEDRGYCRVGLDIVGDKRISTIFLGIPHLGELGLIYYFETLVFSEEDSFIETDGQRYRTLEEAETGHLKWVERIKKSEGIVCEDTTG